MTPMPRARRSAAGPCYQAPDAYASFDRRDDGWAKVLLHPAA
jgi:hypothetical protein